MGLHEDFNFSSDKYELFFLGFGYLFTTVFSPSALCKDANINIIEKASIPKNKRRIILKTWFLITLIEILYYVLFYIKNKKRIWAVHFKATLYESTTVLQAIDFTIQRELKCQFDKWLAFFFAPSLHRQCSSGFGTMGPKTFKNRQIYNSHFGIYSLSLNE